MSTTPPPVASPDRDVPDAMYPSQYYDTADAEYNVHPVMNQLAAMFKKGYRTSEFWLALTTTTVIGADAAFDLGLDTESLTGMAGLVISYVFGRSWLKGKRVAALASTTNPY